MNPPSPTPASRTPTDLAGKRVTVVGLGRFGGGIGVTRWLCSQGATVTVSDKAPPAELAESIEAIQGLDVTLHLGAPTTTDPRPKPLKIEYKLGEAAFTYFLAPRIETD